MHAPLQKTPQKPPVSPRKGPRSTKVARFAIDLLEVKFFQDAAGGGGVSPPLLSDTQTHTTTTHN